MEASSYETILVEGDFRDFAFANSVLYYGGANPDFFEGTVVEGAADKVLNAA